MELWQKIGLAYLIVANLTGFVIMGEDKHKAKKGAWRIPEKTLFLVAIVGGSIGSILGMYMFHHKTKHKKFVIGMPVILLIQLVCILFAVYQYQWKEAASTQIHMGTVVSAVVYGSDSADTAETVMQVIDNLDNGELSWRKPESAVAVINKQLSEGQEVPLYQQEQEWLQDTKKLCEASGGALDITIHPLVELWGIEGEQPKVPEAEEIREALGKTGYEGLHIDKTVWADSTDYSIDLGAVGKGIAADAVQDYLEQTHTKGAIISIGGTVLAYGRKPDNQSWQVGIRDPRGAQDAVMGLLQIEDGMIVSTSGDYEKYFIQDGIRYHHIMNPATGYPADSGLMSVTVVCSSGLASDGLSTACFVLGYEDSISLLEQYQAEAIFITNEKEVYVTDGLQDAFTIVNTDYQKAL